MQLSIFDLPDPLPPVSGLKYFREFVDIETELLLLNHINKNQWLTEMKRRVQHYGYKYDYRTRRIDESMKVGTLPEWTKDICTKLIALQVFKNIPDQLIINEYEPGQGIADHIDCEPCFGQTIVSLSLGSNIDMRFKNESDEKFEINQIYTMILERRSLLVLDSDARYKWKHGISNSKYYNNGHNKIKREKRVSLTFRSIIL